MFSKIKSLFKEQNNPESAPSDFKHPEINGEEIGQCPFMSKQKNGTAPAPQKTEKKTKQNADSETQSEPEEKPRGGCPFMASSGTKKNPNLGLEHQGFDEPYVSKFKYYLSENKVNFDLLKKGKKSAPIIRYQFNEYPIYLKHTLFYHEEDYQKVRSFECCSRFLAYEQLRERGNKHFNKGRYTKAIDFYERAMSLFRWLEHKEPETQSQMGSQAVIEDIVSQSEISEDESMLSKIPINLGSEQASFLSNDNNEQFEKFKSTHKQFFTIYHDDNVVYCNGEQLTEDVDLDMRKSLLVQLYLNMAATYIKLDHHYLAYEVLGDAMKLSDKVSQIYLRLAQVALSNKSSTIEQLQEGLKNINKAIQMQPQEKIFKNTNANILKMVNIHDAKQVYADVAYKLTARINEEEKRKDTMIETVSKRLAQINEIQIEMIKEGKIPREGGNHQLLSQGTDFKILRKIYDKYVRIMEFFTEAKDKTQLNLAKKQFQQVLRVLNEINFIESLPLDTNNSSFGEDKQKIENRLRNIQKQKCEDLYNSARYNFQVLEWAIKEVVNEEHQQKLKKEAQQKQEAKMRAQETQGQQVQQKSNFMSKIPYVMVIVPVIGIIANFLI